MVRLSRRKSVGVGLSRSFLMKEYKASEFAGRPIKKVKMLTDRITSPDTIALKIV